MSRAVSLVHTRIQPPAGAHRTRDGLSRGDAHMRRTGRPPRRRRWRWRSGAAQRTASARLCPRALPRLTGQEQQRGTSMDPTAGRIEWRCRAATGNGFMSCVRARVAMPRRGRDGLALSRQRIGLGVMTAPWSNSYLDGKSGNDYGVLSRGPGAGGLQKCFACSASRPLPPRSGPSAYVRCLLQQSCVVSPNTSAVFWFWLRLILEG